MRMSTFLALLALTPAAAFAQAEPGVQMVPVAGTVLDVSAQGRVSRVPDVATIRAGVVTQAVTAAAALADQASAMSRVLAALRRAGVQPRDIATANVGLSPQYRYVENQPPQITGYQATNTVAIRFRDVARAGGILDALVAAGANQIDGPSLTVDQPDAALDEARTEAIKIARARAELYAQAAGLRVRRIISIAEAGVSSGGPRPPVVYARIAAADARTEIAAGEAELSVSVQVRFLLD
ncbi:MAG: rane protein [Sphingomonas bacterium]|uniref:SIMPL domain-containing protein n=1 Tax=Sphingomonas bacterium TaxID=1895847 RepID=UPI00261C22E8|nr:SIMPL domain-containing protein [Sphingomonas bacterium]MDB5696574.1 rane protein [Sphingomonas bacterium]